MKRRAFKLIAFLLAGAIINVAVAWGCWHFSMFHQSPDIPRHTAEKLVFPNRAPPPPYYFFNAFQLTGFGKILVHVSVRWLPEDAKHIYDYASAHDRAFLAGWPMLAVIGWSRRSDNGTATHEDCIEFHSVVPARPLWPGFAINTIFYAAVLWALFAAPLTLRKRLRIKRGQCASCGYSLRGTVSEVCPECGRPTPSPAKRERAGVRAE